MKNSGSHVRNSNYWYVHINNSNYWYVHIKNSIFRCDPEFFMAERLLTICRNYFVICTYQQFQNSWYVHIANSGLSSKMAFHRVALNISTAGHVLGRPFFAVKVADSHVGIWTLSNAWFPESTRVHFPNGILIGSAVVAGLMVVTDRPHYTICCNRLHLAA